ncbi:hypothetical protein QYF36_012320 [Acer negundo]|nr:hypothetical protein QYF36_012320 [Acer negundo]
MVVFAMAVLGIVLPSSSLEEEVACSGHEGAVDPVSADFSKQRLAAEEEQASSGDDLEFDYGHRWPSVYFF